VAFRSLNARQRVVIVAGLAFALYWLGRWIISAGSTNGWIAYAPLSGASSGAPYLFTHLWAQLLIWLGLVLVWVVFSLLIFRSPAEETEEESRD
jgi:heme/copper-type cytochrome/quinol oxidase subunit 1